MIFVCPEQRIGNEEIADLGTSIIKDQRAPVRMHALSWIQMFIQAGSVKAAKSERIFRKMCRYPVQDHTDSLLMEIIHKIHEIFTGSISAGRRIISGYLIAPGTVKRMFHNGHDFHMGVSHLFHIVCQFWSNFTIIVKEFIFRFDPGSHMYFINEHRRIFIIDLFSAFHPLRIFPLILFQIHYNRSILRS